MPNYAFEKSELAHPLGHTIKPRYPIVETIMHYPSKFIQAIRKKTRLAEQR